jgi:hypothetical protein
MSEEESDLTNMDDPQFTERRRVREALEHIPDDEVSPELAVRYQQLNDEFIRRARVTWGHAS